MFKKLIALVEALMLVSLFCIGFASWSIIDPDGIEITLNDGGFQTQETQEVLLSEIGITAENVGRNASDMTSFKYSLINSTATFAKTTLTLRLSFNIAAMDALAVDHDIKYALVVECVNPNAEYLDIFSSDTTNTYLTPSTIATAHLEGLPLMSVSGNVTVVNKSRLSAYFPLKTSSGECLYHLINRASGDEASVVFTFDFTPKGTVDSNYIKAICLTPYKFNVGVGTKK